tara:strand:+ start:238 stop:528 length:291 start_codon:yes stop_codon:yes gene_type:complete
MNRKPKYKIERFIELLIQAGVTGIEPIKLAMLLNSMNVHRFVQQLRSEGVDIKTKPNFSLRSEYDAKLALACLNDRRKRSGANELSEEFIKEWLYV